MNWFKNLFFLALCILTLNTEAQDKFRISTVKVGYTPITYNRLFNQNIFPFDENRTYSDNMFVLSLLSDIDVNDILAVKLGVSYSRLRADNIRGYKDRYGNQITYYDSLVESVFWFETYVEHRLQSKLIRNFYYGLSVGYLVGDNTTYIKDQSIGPDYFINGYPKHTEHINLNINAGVEFNLYRNTNAYLELGFYGKGMLTVGLSQHFFKSQKREPIY